MRVNQRLGQAGIAMLIVLAASALALGLRAVSKGGSEAQTVTLPNACDNLVAASERLAEEGSSAAVDMTRIDVFDPASGDPQANLLESLVKSCDEHLASP